MTRLNGLTTDMRGRKAIECVPLTPRILADEWSEGTLIGRIQYNPLILAEQQYLINSAYDLMSTRLKLREQRILEYRFGLKGNAPHSLRETGKEFGVSRGRIQQIEQKALEKLRKALFARGWSNKIISQIYN